MSESLETAVPGLGIAEPGALVDAGRLREDLRAILAGRDAGDALVRTALLDRLKAAMKAGREEAERRLMADRRGLRCAAGLAHLLDGIVRSLYELVVASIYPVPNPSTSERLAVVAVGGYGRGTLAPGSDIDLLFLLPYKQTAWGESVVEYMLYVLWDLGLKVGHAARNTDECIRLARGDATILTALLEARWVAGDGGLFEQLVARYRKEVTRGARKQFIASKLAERDRRHARAGESRYLVEPDVKDGKGGLRDLHTLFWIARFLHDAHTPRDLVAAGMFTAAEAERFRRCEDFLWAARCHLHFISRRGTDRLSFDRQAEIAERLGYKSRGGLKHVERFMKHYFLMAKHVGDLTRIFCAVLEAQELAKVPPISRLIRRLRLRADREIEGAPGFRIDAGRINVEGSKVFTEDPVNLLRVFHLAHAHGLEVHPEALSLLRRSLRLIDDRLRNSAEANALFLDVLTSKNHPDTILRHMNEAGVLGRFLPEFGRIVAMMQFNMYHHFTVDEHLLRALGLLAQIERGELAEDHPLASEIFPTLTNRRALYVAVFLHDIAKGRAERHSIAGERVAQALCPRLGLSAAETETVAWLVRHHLVMSETAQMRDLNDYKSILDFAQAVQSPERLKLLLILTVADIRAVGPGVWNGWKGQLLRTLYFETEPVLTGGHTRISRDERLVEAHRAFAERVPDWPVPRLMRYLARHYDPYWLNVDANHQLAHARLIERAEASGEKIATTVETDRFTAITELAVFAPDHPRLLALMTGACAAAGANIAGAQIFTTADGMALDTLLIQREFAEEADEQRRAERVAELIRKALAGSVRIADLIRRDALAGGRIKAFSVEAQVAIDNNSSNISTLIEVNGLDRIGLLYDLTEGLFRLNVNIASAQIATFGERAVDVFYVTDLTGAKITNAGRRASIERQLLAILAPDPQRGAQTGAGSARAERRAAFSS